MAPPASWAARHRDELEETPDMMSLEEELTECDVLESPRDLAEFNAPAQRCPHLGEVVTATGAVSTCFEDTSRRMVRRRKAVCDHRKPLRLGWATFRGAGDSLSQELEHEGVFTDGGWAVIR